MIIRSYQSKDYEQLATLYKQSELYGGQFDEARDSAERLEKLIKNKPDAILVAEDDGSIVGTVTLFEDGRSAWLYRFAVKKGMAEVAKLLFEKAKEILKQKGHSQILVYAPLGGKDFENRYMNLGFAKGKDFTSYLHNLE